MGIFMENISSKEKKQHGSLSIPYSYYECHIPEYFPFVPLHWHKEFEINYIISGKGRFTYGNKSFVTGEGDIIIVLPGKLHAIYPYGDFNQVYDTLVFREEMLSANKEERSFISCISPMINGNCDIAAPVTRADKFYCEIKKCVEQVFTNMKKNTPVADLHMKSALLYLICLLEENGIIKTIKKQDDRTVAGIRSALVFINQNYMENISTGQLAEIVHLSKSYFMYCFKKATGTSVIEYVIQLRIKNACTMLRDTSAYSTEIAYACGFRNLSNFNRQFKKYTGYTPKQYRQLYKNSQPPR